MNEGESTIGGPKPYDINFIRSQRSSDLDSSPDYFSKGENRRSLGDTRTRLFKDSQVNQSTMN
jgi:hypothetical protein